MFKHIVTGIFFLAVSFSLQAVENRYEIKIEISSDMKKASCTQSVTYTNPNTFSLDTLYFRVRYPGDDPRCEVHEITGRDGGALSFDSCSACQGVLAIGLPQPLKPGKPIELTMGFSVPVEYRPYYIFGYLTNYHCWHPRAVPYFQGKLRPQWREFAAYRVTIRVPETKKIVTTGKIISETSLANGFKELIAEASHVTNYGIFFFNQLQTEEKRVQDITIQNHFVPDSAEWTRGLADKAAEIVQSYIDTVGFYPQEIIHIIPGSFTFGGGFPIASNIFEIHQLGGKDKEGITAHEIAHIYWGYDYILVPDQYDQHWLRIGMGIYTDQFYRKGKPPYGGDYLTAAYAGYNTQMMQSDEEFAELEYDWNSVICHNKAFAVIKMLEYVVGKQTFHNIYRELLNRYGYRVITVDDFINITQEISGEDLGWFFHHWLYTNHILDYQIKEVITGATDEGFLTRVNVMRTGEIPMPVEIGLTTVDSAFYKKTFPHDLEEGYVEFTTDSPLLDVELDPEKRLTIFSRLYDEWGYEYVMGLFEKGEYQRCLELSERLLFRNPDDLYTKCFRGMAFRKLGKLKQALDTFQDIIHEQEIAWFYIQIGYIYDLQNLRERAVEEYQKALKLPDFRGSRKEAEKRLETPYYEEALEN
jgi:tetratricopeptide (TPR) repeat protein